MMASILMGIVAGARSLTPLATVAWMAQAERLPNDGPLERFLGSPGVVIGATLLAASEMAGDKMRSAPDRIVAPGLAARLATGAIAGAALASGPHRGLAALMGASVAAGSSYLSFAARRRAMDRFGQRPTGIAEDAVVLLSAVWIAGLSGRPGRTFRSRFR